MSILFRHGYKNKSRLNSGLKPARFLGFQSFSNFSPVLPSKSAFFAANLFLFEYVLFLFDYFFFLFVCFLPSILLDFYFFSKLKTNPDSTEDSIPDSNLHVSLFFCFSAFFHVFLVKISIVQSICSFCFFSFLPSLCFLFVFLDPSVESRSFHLFFPECVCFCFLILFWGEISTSLGIRKITTPSLAPRATADLRKP